MVKRVHITVQGLVQGVGFRAATRRTANTLNLYGVARNLWNDDVEIVAEGEEADLKRLVEWARHGPSTARVEDVRAEYSDATGAYRDFTAE